MIKVENMFRGDNSSSLSYEHQAKFINERINTVEKHFGELCSAFGDYARKNARLRDKGDELAKVLKDYSSNEIVNKSLSNGLENVSVTLNAIEEYRNCEIQRIEAKVIGELSQYEAICKHAREEVKHTINVREKELSRKKVLDKAKERQPFNRQHINYAESELLKASAEMSRTAKGLSEQTEFFEKRKLQQLKELLTNFVMIEMNFHAKAVELYTIAYQQVDQIDDAADLEHLVAGLSFDQEPVNFRRKLMSPEKQINSGIPGRSTSLASLMMNQESPTKFEGSLTSPEKLNGFGGITRASSLGNLKNHTRDDNSDDSNSDEEGETSSEEDTD